MSHVWICLVKSALCALSKRLAAIAAFYHVAVLACLLLGANLVQAQVTDPAVFSFTPSPPRADRAFLLTIQVDPCLHSATFLTTDPTARSVSIAPGHIEITQPYAPIILCPDLLESYPLSVLIDPVPAGDYQLDFFGQDENLPQDPTGRHLLYSTQVTVVTQSNAIPNPSVVPATSGPGMVLLGALVLGGFIAHRRLNS
jgi:hypothetical protein